MLIISDLHGDIKTYAELISGVDESIQIGDFGFKEEHDWHLANVDSSRHKILFGNHDYYPYLDKPHSLGNFGWQEIDDLKVFWIRGAYSIDKFARQQHIDWFPEEELNYTESVECINLYCKVQPDVVLSHDCPQFVRKYFWDIEEASNTSNLLEACWMEHQPKQFIHGHHHCNVSKTIGGTFFQCLGIGQAVELIEV